MNSITGTIQAIRRGSSRARRAFLSDVLAGLQMTPKQLPCKYFYDQRGSELFDRICQLDEYYLTRSEFRTYGSQKNPLTSSHILSPHSGQRGSVRPRRM